jgi:hypothetical protein
LAVQGFTPRGEPGEEPSVGIGTIPPNEDFFVRSADEPLQKKIDLVP